MKQTLIRALKSLIRTTFMLCCGVLAIALFMGIVPNNGLVIRIVALLAVGLVGALVGAMIWIGGAATWRGE